MIPVFFIMITTHSHASSLPAEIGFIVALKEAYGSQLMQVTVALKTSREVGEARLGTK
jgi:hypothetical protein